MKRRDFVKNVMIGGAAISLAAASWPTPLFASQGKQADIGQCKSIKITAVSEVGWWDNGVLKKDLLALGSPKKADQWKMAWDKRNAAGSCSLIEATGLDGKVTRILLDTGWDPEYMTWRFESTGVDKLLRNKKIDYLVLSHEHLDHLWGITATLALDPEITIVMPSTFHRPAREFINGTSFKKAGAFNDIKHQGKVMVMDKGGIHKLKEGIALSVFDIPIILKIQGEQSLYFNVKDRGLVLVTGCCHQNIINFASFAQKNIKGGNNLYGLYGGLHIAPFGPITEKGKEVVRKMGQFNFKKMACNHCTGITAVKMMKELGYPVVGGGGLEGTLSKLYVGNGDVVTFGETSAP